MQARERGVEFVSIVDMRKILLIPPRQRQGRCGIARVSFSFCWRSASADVAAPITGRVTQVRAPITALQRPLLLPFKIDRTTRTALATTSGASITHGVPATGPAATPASGFQAITFW